MGLVVVIKEESMRRVLTLVLAIGLSGLGLQLAAQQEHQRPSDQQPSSQQPSDQRNSQQQTDANSSNQSAQTFQGKIAKSGGQLVFQEATSQTAYQLDDQSKVAPYEGKSVKLMATIDPKTNTLHVIDVAPAESK
jgi:hypothetical protein